MAPVTHPFASPFDPPAAVLPAARSRQAAARMTASTDGSSGRARGVHASGEKAPLAHARGEAPRVLLAGGKSGGHVFPALAVGEELERRGWEVALVGRAEGMEQQIANQRGVAFHAVEAEPIVGRGPLARVSALWVLLRSTLAARRLVRRQAPRVVLGTGGFVSAPTVLGAWLCRVPVLLLEPNAQVGKANRFLSRFAAEAVVAHESSLAQLHCSSRVTGVPVRAAFFEVAPWTSTPGAPLRVLVLGGSQGSLSLNRALPRAMAILRDRLAQRMSGTSRDRRVVDVRHQAGRSFGESTREDYERSLGVSGEGSHSVVHFEVTEFVEDPATAMAQVDVVVSRAGAITLAELCAAGRAGVLVPLALAGAHQRDNASALVRAEAAVVVEEPPGQDRGVGAERLGLALADALDALLEGGEARLQSMATAARSLAHPDACERIADRVEYLGTKELPS